MSEMNKWLKKNLRRLDVFIMKKIFFKYIVLYRIQSKYIKVTNLIYRHSNGAYITGNVPKSATKFLAVALALVAEAHAQSTLPTTPVVSFAPATFGSNLL